MPKILSDNGHSVATLDSLNVLSLQALRAFDHVELHGLALLQASESARLNRREMHKNIFAGLSSELAVAFGVVEPLHCSLFCHLIVLFPFLNVLRRKFVGDQSGTCHSGRRSEPPSHATCLQISTQLRRLYGRSKSQAQTFEPGAFHRSFLPRFSTLLGRYSCCKLLHRPCSPTD